MNFSSLALFLYFGRPSRSRSRDWQLAQANIKYSCDWCLNIYSKRVANYKLVNSHNKKNNNHLKVLQTRKKREEKTVNYEANAKCDSLSVVLHSAPSHIWFLVWPQLNTQHGTLRAWDCLLNQKKKTQKE